MISKHYSIFCDECTRTEALFGQSIKDCTDEAKNMRWTTDSNKQWYCPECSVKKAEQSQEA